MQLTIPVEPGPDEARDWLLDELAKPEYQAAKPSWFDELASGFFDWLDGLFRPTGTAADAVAPLLALLIVAALIVGAFFIFGRPRLRRGSRRQAGSVFGSEDGRSAAQLRAAASRAHAAGDDTTAIEELFRALARRLDERDVVPTSPAMTAQEFAGRAAPLFRAEASGLAAAAATFDAVRYLGGTGTASAYKDLEILATTLWDQRAVTVPVAAGDAR